MLLEHCAESIFLIHKGCQFILIHFDTEALLNLSLIFWEKTYGQSGGDDDIGSLSLLLQEDLFQNLIISNTGGCLVRLFLRLHGVFLIRFSIDLA
jgi:hypothetical protein